MSEIEKEKGEVMETETLFCKKCNHMLIPLNQKLHCTNCNIDFKYKGPNIKVVNKQKPYRPRKIRENN